MESIEEMLETGQALLASFGLNLVAALAILIIGRWVARGAGSGVRRLMDRTSVDPMLTRFVSRTVYIALLVFVVIAAISKVGIQTTSFIAMLGAAGFAIGLALQGSLGNFAAGVLMLVFRPFKVGDYIEGAGTAGVVEEIQIFTTKLRSPDNKRIIVSNGDLFGGTIVNYSANDQRRVDLTVGVGYDDDLDKVRAVIDDELSRDERILAEPAPTVGVLALADSSVNFAVRPWVKTADYWPVLMDLNERLKKRFDREGISIPFPQRDVHLYEHKA